MAGASIVPVALAPDPQQQQVLAHGAGSLLVSGGPGTGKTWILRERFARLVIEGADPERLALVVRSKSARRQARDGLSERLQRSLPDLNVFTPHALAFHVMSHRFSTLDYAEPPTILNASDQFARVQELLAGEDAAQWPAYGSMLHLRGFADEIRQFLLRTQESLLTPDDIETKARAAGLTGWLELAAFYRRYLQVLDDEGTVDYAGLVEQAAAAAREAEPLFDHLLVDDYQDTTFGTEALLAALRPESLVAAGDLGSHIFSFQGYTDEPIRRFEDVMPDPSRIELTEPHRHLGGPRTDAWVTPHTSEEFAAIARELRRVHVEERVPWSDLAVVVRRQSSQLGGLIRALDDASIPRTSLESGLSMLSDPATHPFVLAFRWIARPDQRDDVIEPLLTSDLARLTPAAARALVRATRASGEPPASALAARDGLDAEERERVAALRSALEGAERLQHSVIDAFRRLWRDLPYSARLVQEAEGSAHARRDLDAVMAFTRAVERAGEWPEPSAAAFLEALEAGEEGPGTSGAASRPDAVQVLTAHGTAGEEFDTVIVAGAVEGNFPSLSRPEPMFDLSVLDARITQSHRNRLRLEDERRLFDVVVGRAKRRALFTASDPHEGDPGRTARSRFVARIDAKWSAAPTAPELDEPLTVTEATAAWRRTLADLDAGTAARLAALDGLLALGDEPAHWWFQRDWTDTGRSLHEHIRTSYSKLDSLENCHLAFVLGQELGLDARSGYHAWVGHLVHKLIEETENGQIERTPEAMSGVAMERWQPPRFPSLAVSEAFRKLVNEVIIPNWFDEYGNNPAIESEVRFEFEHDDATVTGFIDRIGPIQSGIGNRITDFKTGNPDNADKTEDNLQLGIYYLAVQRAEGLERFHPVRAVELSFIKGDWKKRLVRSGKQFSESKAPEYEEKVTERLSELIADLKDLNETEVWSPNPGANCRFCTFQPLCPLYPEGQPVFPSEVGV